MGKYIIKGGQTLKGEVNISGAKNAALGIIAATVLSDEDVIIDNVPDVSDTRVMIVALEKLGAEVVRLNRHSFRINCSDIKSSAADDTHLTQIRASYYFIGALLGKCHSASIPLPGGCVIGSRPIDLHIKGFKALGADVNVEDDCVNAAADELVGNEVFLDKVSVGATINIMLAAVLAEGKTTIGNAAKEPHIVDVANFLNTLGARVRGAGTDVIRITGVKRLHGGEYSIIPDQIEAGTFMCAAAITRGDILVRNIIPKHMECISAKLEELGCRIEEYDDSLRVTGCRRLKPSSIMTLPYPGFPTDMQPQITAVLGIANGSSMVFESIFDNRFKYVDELVKMGANIHAQGNVAMVNGVAGYKGASISAPDLRAGAALVLAGLSAEGITVIDDIEFIQRGYEYFDTKLRNLGAEIEILGGS